MHIDADTSDISPLYAPNLESLFWRPTRTGIDSAWTGHIPFAFWLVKAIKPSLLVELGTHNGVSYSAFCDAVLRSNLDARCYAVDTWKGDLHAGEYGEEVFTEFNRFHQAHYAAFSELLRCTFDEALQYFPDGAIDLLHIDGYHTYQAVSKDFERWKTKCSDRAVVLLHDTNVRGQNFGVWKLFAELSEQHPHFEFLHEHGLGILAIGGKPPSAIANLCGLTDSKSIGAIRERFALLGERWKSELRAGSLETRSKTLEQHRERLEQHILTLEQQVKALEQQVKAHDLKDQAARAVQAELERLKAALVGEKEMRSRLAARVVSARKDAFDAASAHVERVKAELVSIEPDLARVLSERDAVLGSTTWKATWPARRIAHWLPVSLRRNARRALRVGWWTATGQLPRRLRSFLSPHHKNGTTSAQFATLVSKIFDEEQYLALNPDVADGVKQGRFRSALDYFLKHGRHEAGRVLRVRLNGFLFDYDNEAYVADNPDVEMLIARGLYKDGFDHLVRAGYRECVDGLRALYGPHRFAHVLRRETGGASRTCGRYLALFAHYDCDYVIDDYVLTYLDALRNAGANICFITAVTDPGELEKVRARAFEIIVKNDAGRDFGSWYLALRTLAPNVYASYDYLLFVNDSIYFPVADPDVFFETMSNLKLNMWGIHDSYETGQYHIQSFFIAFDRLAREIVVTEFIRQYELTPYMTKQGQILTFETGLTRYAMDAGLSVGAYCPIDDVRQEIMRTTDLASWRPTVQASPIPINPTHDLWDLMISRYKSPSLKIQLLRDNPKRVTIDDWPLLVDRHCIDPTLIERHIERIKGPRLRRANAYNPAPARQIIQPQLVHQIEGCGFGSNRRLVLFVHYDPQGIIDDHVARSITAMRACDSDIVLITSTGLAHEIERMRPLCASILVTNNVGRDFGAWYIACSAHQQEFPRYRTVIWMNDSQYFPLFDLNEMFSIMDGKFAFWGVVDSYNIRWHVMSWFWSFDRSINESGLVDWFLREFDPAYTKWDHIKNLEMRVPSMLKSQGFPVGSYISADDVFEYVSKYERSHAGFTGYRGFTMTHDFWDVIIRKFRCPALKVELLRDNPCGYDVRHVFEFVRDHTEYDPELIRRHLKRIKTNHLSELPTSGQRAFTSSSMDVEALQNSGSTSQTFQMRNPSTGLFLKGKG